MSGTAGDVFPTADIRVDWPCAGVSCPDELRAAEDALTEKLRETAREYVIEHGQSWAGSTMWSVVYELLPLAERIGFVRGWQQGRRELDGEHFGMRVLRERARKEAGGAR